MCVKEWAHGMEWGGESAGGVAAAHGSLELRAHAPGGVAAPAVPRRGLLSYRQESRAAMVDGEPQHGAAVVTPEPSPQALEIEQAIIGTCPALRCAIAATRRIGPRSVAVLIEGETGTGKERMARLVHEHSRRLGRFLAVNCAAFTEAILESELFGHERAAFTGASSMKRGLFEDADGGTMFLDEVGEMSPALQAKLLRVLQEATIRRIGSTREITVDVRVVSATHRDLLGMTSDGGFRRDLFFRLAQYRIALPPLRERGRDVVRIARHMLREDEQLAGDRPWRLGRDAERVLQEHDWPGNVRELRNVLLQVVVDATGARIGAAQLRAALPVAEVPPEQGPGDLDRAILDLVRERGEASGPEIREALMLSKSAVQRRLQRLVEAGELQRVGESVASCYRVPAWAGLELSERLDERERLTLRLASEHGQVTRQMLCEVTGLAPRTANRLLGAMVDAGLLVASGRGRARGYAVTWGSLPEASQKPR
jgi:DNA-binding NtrC family response regulator